MPQFMIVSEGLSRDRLDVLASESRASGPGDKR